MHAIVKSASKHLIVFALLTLGMFFILFVIGLFTTLHEDAYRDGFMSIVYVYAIILLVLVAYSVLKRYVPIQPAAWSKRLYAWHKQTGAFVNFALIFTLITVANSVMMITDLDTPKTGAFAYGHLLVRTLIVLLAVAIWMHKEIYRAFKAFKAHFGKEPALQKEERKTFFRRIKCTLFTRPLTASAAMFTTITVLGCLVVVVFSPFLNVQGGERLYASLVMLFAGMCVSTNSLKVIFLDR